MTDPAPAPIKKLKNRFRWSVLLKAPHVKHLHFAIATAMEHPKALKPSGDERITVDIDPYSLS